MAFFDFHVHPTLKCMFSTKESKTDPWKDIDVKKINWVLRWCSDFAYILNSQNNLSQLIRNESKLVCVALFVPERGMTDNDLILKQAQGTLSVYLDPARLAAINDGTLKPYPDLVQEDLKILLDPAPFGQAQYEVIPLTQHVAFNETDPAKLYVVFSVEGCHTLSSTMDKNKISKDEVLANLDELCSSYPIVSLNITHLEQYPFCNHAYGMQFVSTDSFKPTGQGISADGIAIIKHCYSKNILIDIKHMSLYGRQQLINAIRVQPDITAVLQPIVCTHAGFTGLSYADIPDYIEYTPQKKKPYGHILWGKPRMFSNLGNVVAFNPSSINLYNEDIMAILESDGIIGISLDKRILGYAEASSRPEQRDELTSEEEYISVLERASYLTKHEVGEKRSDSFCITTKEVLQGGIVNPAAAFYHLCHFMGHIAHLIKVADAAGYDTAKALTQVCIGSDFDGMINPVWCCDSINGIAEFKADFINFFPNFAVDNQVPLPAGFDMAKIAEQVFYTNGRDFVLARIRIL
jgi:microsomal dipeptidase-like Zn-dependent dipeptidase